MNGINQVQFSDRRNFFWAPRPIYFDFSSNFRPETVCPVKICWGQNFGFFGPLDLKKQTANFRVVNWGYGTLLPPNIAIWDPSPAKNFEWKNTKYGTLPMHVKCNMGPFPKFWDIPHKFWAIPQYCNMGPFSRHLPVIWDPSSACNTEKYGTLPHQYRTLCFYQNLKSKLLTPNC